MTALANRAFARLVLAASALGGFLVLAALELLILSAGAFHTTAPDLLCIVAPVSPSDIAVHGLAVTVSALAAVGVLRAARTVARTRVTAGELRLATRSARLDRLPERLVRPAARAVVLDRVEVVLSPRPFAFVYGWFRPRICISTGLIQLLSEQEMEAVLHHEGWHAARLDPLRFLLAQTVGAVFAAVPHIRQMVHAFLLAAEIAADRHAVMAMGQARPLASALAKTIMPAVAVPGFEGQAEARIAALAGEVQRTAGSGRLIAFVVLVELVALIPLLSNGSLIALVGLWVHPMC